uniref:Uncharacterized protein n=1 Tax=Brassica oleracea var. oleracea TaxID=109376 RepID=A0A0D3B5L1_BRAOL
MSTNSDDEVYGVFEEMVDQQIDDYIESALTKQPKTRVYIERDREVGHIQLWQDYFSENPTYTHDLFRRRFRMNKSLFLRIVERLGNEVPYFQQRRNGHGRNGLSTLQKCTSAMRMLAYGRAGDANDEYLRLGARESSRSSKVRRRESVNVDMLNIRNLVRDPQIHERLKADLVENVWAKFGDRSD